MKFVLVVVAVVVLWLLLRGRWRQSRPTSAKDAPPSSPSPQAMLSCAHCGIHLPRDEALPGRGGVFCDSAHRDAFERAHPGP